MKDRVFDVLGGPGRWIAGEQALQAASGAFAEIPQPLCVVGEFFLLQAARARLIDPLVASGYDLREQVFPEAGECCPSNVALIIAAAKDAGSLVAIGGGKCIDSVKLAGQNLRLPVVTIPSSSATCACATAVAVLYDERGVYSDTLELDQPPMLVLLDTIFMTEDVRFLAAGVVDTAAKWLEWLVLPQAARDGFGAEAGLALAQRAWEMVNTLAPTRDACRLNREILLEATMLLLAQASCLGAVPAALAHSVCNGLSLMPQCRQLLHGELVGMGLLVQDAFVEARGQNLEGAKTRRQWLKALGMPTTLDLSMNTAARDSIVSKILSPGESALAMEPRADKDEIAKALTCLEQSSE